MNRFLATCESRDASDAGMGRGCARSVPVESAGGDQHAPPYQEHGEICHGRRNSVQFQNPDL